MARVLAEDRLREALIQKGLARARRYTWDSVAQKTLELYAALA
jgi:glycosyltransferase involved in cell wall biosynthesis